VTSSRKKVTNTDAPKNKTKTVATRATRAHSQVALWALLPSAEQLRLMVAGPAKDTSAQSSGRDRGASLGIPPALLNPLESLPRPLSLDEVKQSLQAAGAARETPTK
jgi:hypothetical protein